jgi:hypothetical protein
LKEEPGREEERKKRAVIIFMVEDSTVGMCGLHKGWRINV